MMTGSSSLPREYHRLELWLRRLPGLMAWGTFIGIAVFSFFIPTIIAYMLLLYALFWLFRSVGFFTRLIRCYFYLTQDMATSWGQRLKQLERADQRLAEIRQQQQEWWKQFGVNYGRNSWWSHFCQWWYRRFWQTVRMKHYRQYHLWKRESKDLIRYRSFSDSEKISPSEVYHVVIVPIYKEPMSVLEPTLAHLAQMSHDLKRAHIILAMEEADPQAHKTATELIQQYWPRIPNLYASFHKLAVGEVAGKSANESFALRWFEKHFIDIQGKEKGGTDASRNKKKISHLLDSEKNDHIYIMNDGGVATQLKKVPSAHLLVTSLDADYRSHDQYLSYLTYRYLVDSERDVHLFQPIPMFFNNLWRVNMFSRMVATMSTQVQMARQFECTENRSFSSYGVNFHTIKDSGYWDVDVIQEDSRLFWKIFFTKGERVRVEPLFLPVYGDAVHASNYFTAVSSLYSQMRRWAWGATDVPYVILRSYHSKVLSLRAKSYACFSVIRVYFDWATLPVILGFGSIFPFYLNESFRGTVIFYNLPEFTSRILTLSTIGFIGFLYVDTLLSPPKPKHWNRYERNLIFMQWFAMPLLGIFFVALPAVDSQTRMMVGKNLDYKVTEKGA